MQIYCRCKMMDYSRLVGMPSREIATCLIDATWALMQAAHLGNGALAYLIEAVGFGRIAGREEGLKRTGQRRQRGGTYV